MNPLRAVRDLFRPGVQRRGVTVSAGASPAAPILSGTFVTPQTSIGLTPVYAAIRTIGTDYASLPIAVYKKAPGGGLEIDEDVYLNERLRVSPNDEIDSFRWRRDAMGHVLGYGNHYSEIVRDSSGAAIAFNPCHPAQTKPKREDNGKLFYELPNGKKVLPWNMLHFAGLGFDGLRGYGTITVARQSVGLSIAAEQFGASFFGNGAVMRGFLKLKKKLKGEALSNLRDSINNVHQGSMNAHQFGILEEDMDWVANQVSPEEAQFLATRQFQVLEIARLFGLPPHKIGDYSQAHLANVEESNLDYICTTLAGWVAMIEAQMNWKLLTREDRKTHVILHDFSALMRGNQAARAAYYQTMRNMGCMSADDIRAKEGMNPLGPGKGGDLYLVQSQYTRLERAGQPIEPAPKTREAA